MKLNATPRHYMPLPQNQSDEEETGPIKHEKNTKLVFKSSFDASTILSKSAVQSQVVKMNIKTLPMAPLRKLAFVSSLIMCVLFVIIFVYFIPCSRTTDLNRTFHLTFKWKKIFHNMSFFPPLEYVNSNNAGTPLVIIGSTESDSSLIAIQENNGKEHWKLHFHSSLLAALCNILDVNSDRIPDCFVIGKRGLFAAIDVEKGTILWYLHNHSDIMNAQSISNPMIVPDCDGDGMMDIIISYYLDKEDKSSYLAFVSGATGQLIGLLINIPHCLGPITKQFMWKAQNESYLIFYCAETENSNLWMISIKQACQSALKTSTKLSLKNMFRLPPFAKEIDIYQPSTREDELVIVLDGVKFLLLRKSYVAFELKWKTYVEGELHMGILTDGYFLKDRHILIISSINTSFSKIMGIDLSNGKVLPIVQLNVSVKTGKKLQHYFGDTDGLILNAIQILPDNITETKKSEQAASYNFSDNLNTEKFEKPSNSNYTLSFKEKYILLKCGKTPLLKTIHSEKLSIVCKGSNCHPDAFTKDSTVIVKKSVLNFSFDIMTVSSTRLSSSNATKEMVVNFLNLENISRWSTCSN